MNRKSARTLCKKQLSMGKRVLRTKTRKAAANLLKKVPGLKPGDFNAGLSWWDYIQMVPKGQRSGVITARAKPMLEGCIKKYSS